MDSSVYYHSKCLEYTTLFSSLLWCSYFEFEVEFFLCDCVLPKNDSMRVRLRYMRYVTKMMGNNLLYLEEACTLVYEYVKKTGEYLRHETQELNLTIMWYAMQTSQYIQCTVRYVFIGCSQRQWHTIDPSLRLLGTH